MHTVQQPEVRQEDNIDVVRRVNAMMMLEHNDDKSHNIQCPHLFTYQPGGMIAMEIISLPSILSQEAAAPFVQQQIKTPVATAATWRPSSSATTTTPSITRALDNKCILTWKRLLGDDRLPVETFNIVPTGNYDYRTMANPMSDAEKTTIEILKQNYFKNTKRALDHCLPNDLIRFMDSYPRTLKTAFYCYVANLVMLDATPTTSIDASLPQSDPYVAFFKHGDEEGCLGPLVLLPTQVGQIRNLFVQWFYGISPIAENEQTSFYYAKDKPDLVQDIDYFLSASVILLNKYLNKYLETADFPNNAVFTTLQDATAVRFIVSVFIPMINDTEAMSGLLSSVNSDVPSHQWGPNNQKIIQDVYAPATQTTNIGTKVKLWFAAVIAAKKEYPINTRLIDNGTDLALRYPKLIEFYNHLKNRRAADYAQARK